jgi:hypothetical protein
MENIVAMSRPEKVRENRLRRALDRQGFRLIRSARRDPRARDYGQYTIVDERDAAVAGWPTRRFSLDDVERWVEGKR